MFDRFCHTDFTKYTWLKILSSVTLEYGTHKPNSRRSNAWFYVSVFLRLWKSFQNCLGFDTKRFKSLREYNMTLMCSFFIILRLILKLIFKNTLTKWLKLVPAIFLKFITHLIGIIGKSNWQVLIGMFSFLFRQAWTITCK